VTSSSTDVDLREVRLVGFPLKLWEKTQEHSDELIREFTLIAMESKDPASRQHVPARLLALIDELTVQYAGVAAAPEAARDEAIARGDETADLNYLVPPGVAEACRALDVILDEADEFCRRGEHLLTLAFPPEAVRFRKWFVEEFIRQVDGADPVPWPEYPA
jgi:hypothetical protein